MNINYIAFSIPLFVAFMLLEYEVARRKKLNYFNLHTSIANISIGIAERLTDVFISGIFYFVYNYLQLHYGLFHIKSSLLVWVLLFLGTDFIWYWYHRLAHEINIFWAAHIVHHQSEDFNYTVSARITVFQAIVRTAFWCILPLLGFPAYMITVMLLIHGLYPFFIHTRMIGKLGWLEYVLVTPSHHRVHHACNEQYLDKNFGDVLIIWDKLFGTFAPETEEPVYGLTKQLHTSSFLWQHFHFFIELYLDLKSRASLKGKLRLIFGSPQLINPDTRVKAERIFSIKQQKIPLQARLNTYVIWQTIGILVILFVFVLFEGYFDVPFKVLFSAFTLLTLINCGAIMEQKKWIFDVECLRIIVFGSMIWPYCARYEIAVALAFIFLIALLLFYRTAKTAYLSKVYRLS